MQTALTYRTNRDLFSNYYLDEHLPETEAWDELSDDELREAKADIMDLWEREQGTAPKRNESQLEEKFIRPMFRKLGIPFEVEESTSRTQRRPDYGFFESEDAARGAFERREEGGDFYKDAVAVADAKRWGRPLDTRGSGEHERDFENPSYQIHVYLQETPARWAVLTDGKKWRLYYGPTSHRLDSYYEIDLPTVLEKGDLEEFKYFYLFFRHGAFLEDSSGECFLDEVYDESNVFAQELGEDLQDNIYEAIKILSEGFMQYPDNDLSEDDLDLIHDSSLIYLYRLIFVLYAESEGRDLLDTNNEIYEESYSLNSLKQEIAEELDSANPKYRDWQDNLWDRLDELFKLIDQGSKSRGIPEEDLYIPAYNGGLFRTDPDEDDSVEARFLANHQVGDAYLAEVIELLTRSQNGNGGGKIFVDYSSLDVRHLGSIYEGLLEYKLNIAEEPLTLDDGEYVAADDSGEIVVQKDEVYLTTDSGERKATGSFYTPEYVVEYIIENTLGPLVEDIREDLVGQSAFDEGGFAAEFAERVFELKILDPAMGSGHFLTNAVDYLAREIINAQERQAEQQGVESIDQSHDINWARRQVAQRCIYGVDLNPLAVELAKVSLWLRTLAAEQPLAFLDHHLKTGNSLVGSDIEDVLSNGNSGTEDGQLTLQQSFAQARQQALEHVMDRFQELLSIDNESLEDIKEMEAAFGEVRSDPLYQHLLAMANTYTAEEFGLDVPGDAYERMAEALRDDSWEEIEEQDWFKSAQVMAGEQHFFHWELEFPVAFYSGDGNRKENEGFDAVIGNPPYVRQEQLSDSKPYLSQRYDCYDSAADLYSYFIERGQSILRDGGMFGYIVSNKFIHADYGEGIRRRLANQTSIKQIVDFHSLPVFSREVTAYPAILLLDNGQPKPDSAVEIGVMEDLDFEQLESAVQDRLYEIPQESLDSQSWSLQKKEVRGVLSKINEHSESLESYLDVSLYRGILTGLNEAFILSAEESEELGYDGEHLQPLLRGKDVHRYEVDYKRRYLIRIPSGWTKKESGISDEADAWSWFKSEFPVLADYLSEFEEQSKQRHDRGEFWWELRPCDYYGVFEDGKIVYPVISKGPNFAFDSEGRYINDKLYAIPGKRFELLGILNSKLIHFWLQAELSGLRGGYQEFRATHVEELPVMTDLEAADRIRQEVSDVIELRQRRNNLNLKLLDYLGNYAEGPDLPDIGLFQPSGNDILNKTTDEYDSLRIGKVKTEHDGNRVTILTTVRYKPDDEGKYETDQWGYTETGYYEAFTLADLTEKEAAFIKAFIPVAVDEGDGFAGFREHATKTNSPIDRLKAITLPKPNDVADDIERYIETKERAEELEAKIEKSDQLIDETVYDLYGLTDEEIEIVESAVEDD
jgi:type II restriction/modification system DNA methylase subunit YeeA